MNEWDLVFNAGWHTDANGNKKLWTTDDLDRIVNTFRPSFHEPPVVIGHPDDRAPAYGWVEGIKRVGNDLFLKYKDVAAEFQEWVKTGRYRKRSISLYPDGSLRHVGFLGAKPPAIKGLPDFAFADNDRTVETYDFSDWRMNTLGRIVMKIRDYLVEKEGADKADTIINSWEVQDLLTPPPEQDEPISSYQEEDHMKVEEVEAIVTKAVGAATLVFSEQVKVLGEQNKKLGEQLAGMERNFSEAADATARREFTSFCEALPTRIIPAEIPTIVDQMMNLRKAAPLEFGEGDQKKTVSAVDDFKTKLQARSETVQFGEYATGDRAGKRPNGDGLDAVTLARKATDFQEAESKAGRTVTLSQALLHVEKEMGGAA